MITTPTATFRSVTTASTTWTVTGPNTVEVGEILIAYLNSTLSQFTATGSTTGSPTWPSGWIPLLPGVVATADGDQSVYVGYKWVAAADVTTTGVNYTWTWTGSPVGGVTFVRVPGADRSSKITVAGVNLALVGNTSVSIPTPYVENPSTMLAFFHSNESAVVTDYWNQPPTAPWTAVLANATGGGDTYVSVATRQSEEGSGPSLTMSVLAGQSDALSAVVVAIPRDTTSPPGLVWNAATGQWRSPGRQYGYPSGVKTPAWIWQQRQTGAWVRVKGPSTTALAGFSAGEYVPGFWTTGVPPGTSLTRQDGDITVTVNGTVIENLDLHGRIIVNASNVIIRKCIIRGTNAAPSASATPLINARSASCVNLLVEDCEIAPQFPHWFWEGGITGHDFVARRCNIHSATDGINVYNTFSPGTATNTTIEFNWIHDLSWWSASAAGVVHPSDTVTHNDCIQHQGGLGTIIRGNHLSARYRRNFGHWYRTGTTEPFPLVATGSRADGSPFQAIPNAGTGTQATGRYNLTDLSALMINFNVGESRDLVFTDNFVVGGYIPVNAGGPVRTTGNLGTFHRNRFSREAGAQASGGNNVYTLNFDASWVGFVDAGETTANKNVFDNDSAEVLVRYNG